MNKKGPVLIIDDDEDDRELIGEVFKKLGYENEIKYFPDGKKALDYLLSASELSFLILSDINMPIMGGLELKENIDSNHTLRQRNIPFVFFTTATTTKAITEAFAHTDQGFFIKPSTFSGLEISVKKILDYWSDCVTPNNY